MVSQEILVQDDPIDTLDPRKITGSRANHIAFPQGLGVHVSERRRNTGHGAEATKMGQIGLNLAGWICPACSLAPVPADLGPGRQPII